MKGNRALFALLAIALGIVIGAILMRGERGQPDTPELPSVAIETQ